jgi:hypothetical protein
LVLVRNTGADSDLVNKTKPKISRSHGSHQEDSEWRIPPCRVGWSSVEITLRCNFGLFLYFARSRTSIPVTRVLDRGDLAAVVEEEASSPSNGALTNPRDGVTTLRDEVALIPGSLQVDFGLAPKFTCDEPTSTWPIAAVQQLQLQQYFCLPPTSSNFGL